ncbi:MAG TPA: hypothetical protein VIH35_02580 [Kiritimatiellia bacterium]
MPGTAAAVCWTPEVRHMRKDTRLDRIAHLRAAIATAKTAVRDAEARFHVARSEARKLKDIFKVARKKSRRLKQDLRAQRSALEGQLKKLKKATRNARKKPAAKPAAPKRAVTVRAAPKPAPARMTPSPVTMMPLAAAAVLQLAPELAQPVDV